MGIQQTLFCIWWCLHFIGKEQTTCQTTLPCTSKWSNWINMDKPDTGDGDRESLTAAHRLAFCPAGKITAVECQTVDGIASYSTGEIQQCTLENGSRCMNDDNFPVPCSDYKIRYFCDCKGFDTYTHTSHDSHTNLNTSWQVRHEPTTVSYSGSYEYHNEARSYSVNDWTFPAPSCIMILMLLYVW